MGRPLLVGVAAACLLIAALFSFSAPPGLDHGQALIVSFASFWLGVLLSLLALIAAFMGRAKFDTRREALFSLGAPICLLGAALLIYLKSSS